MLLNAWCHNFVFPVFGEVMAPRMGLIAWARAGERLSTQTYLWCHNFVFPAFGEVVAPGSLNPAMISGAAAGVR